MKRRVRLELLFALITLLAVPLAVAWTLVDEVIPVALRLATPPELESALTEAQADLKRLRRLDPAGDAEYRARFERIRAAAERVESMPELQVALRKALGRYFLILFAVALACGALVAWLLARRVARAYDEALVRWERERRRSDELTQLARWQEVARRIAHELKNAMTPMDLIVSDLPRLWESRSGPPPVERSREMHRILTEELDGMRRMVESFSRFARLPALERSAGDLGEFLRVYVQSLGESWPQVEATVVTTPTPFSFDALLLRQALHNLVLNAVEANPGRTLKMRFELSVTKDTVLLDVCNDGIEVPAELREALFTPSFTTKPGNMGLGLAVVRKVAVDHGGDVECVAATGGACFRFLFPVSEDSS